MAGWLRWRWLLAEAVAAEAVAAEAVVGFASDAGACGWRDLLRGSGYFERRGGERGRSP